MNDDYDEIILFLQDAITKQKKKEPTYNDLVTLTLQNLRLALYQLISNKTFDLLRNGPIHIDNFNEVFDATLNPVLIGCPSKKKKKDFLHALLRSRGIKACRNDEECINRLKDIFSAELRYYLNCSSSLTVVDHPYYGCSIDSPFFFSTTEPKTYCRFNPTRGFLKKTKKNDKKTDSILYKDLSHKASHDNNNNDNKKYNSTSLENVLSIESDDSHVCLSPYSSFPTSPSDSNDESMYDTIANDSSLSYSNKTPVPLNYDDNDAQQVDDFQITLQQAYNNDSNICHTNLKTNNIIQSDNDVKQQKATISLKQFSNGSNTMSQNETCRRYCRQCGFYCPVQTRSFCSNGCIHLYRFRSSGSFVRRCLFVKDQGICAICKIDCNGLRLIINKMLKRFFYKKPLQDQKEALKNACRVLDITTELRLNRRYQVSAGYFWHADHILPVSQGGGNCLIDNYRTLCIPCHKKVTTEQRVALKNLKKKDDSLEQAKSERIENCFAEDIQVFDNENCQKTTRKETKIALPRKKATTKPFKGLSDKKKIIQKKK